MLDSRTANGSSFQTVCNGKTKGTSTKIGGVQRRNKKKLLIIRAETV